MRRFSIYIYHSHVHIYIHVIILHTCHNMHVWDNDHAPTQIYPSYTHIFVVQLSSSHCIVTISYIMTMLPKLPLRKCPLHSKFLQSSHSVSWNCRPTQYFGHLQNHSIKSRLRVPVLRYYSPSFQRNKPSSCPLQFSFKSQFGWDAISGYGPL